MTEPQGDNSRFKPLPAPEVQHSSQAWLAAIVQQLPVGVIIAEAPSGRLILGNDEVERIWRGPFIQSGSIEEYREYVGFRPDGTPLQPHEWPLARAIAHGEVVSDEEIEIVRQDGTRGTIRVSAAPIRAADGRYSSAVVTFADITSLRRGERSLRFLTEASAIVAASLDYEATLGNVLDLLVPQLADWAVVDLLNDAGEIHRVAMRHRNPDKQALLVTLEERYPHRMTDGSGPVRVFLSGQTEFIPDLPPEAVLHAAKDDEHRDLLRALDIRSYICVPLRARGRTLGAMSLVLGESGRRFDDADVELAEELGRRVALAIDNARLFTAERAARAAAEATHRRLELLADVSTLLGSSLDYDATLERLVQLVVPELTELCVVDILEPDGTIYRPAAAHRDPDVARQALELVRRFPRCIDDDTPMTAILRSGVGALVPAMSEEMHEVVAGDAGLREYGERIQPQFGLVIPLIARGRTLGAITFVADSRNQYDENDVAFFGELAGRAATSIDNARLFRDAQAAERRYRTIFEGSADALLVTDADSRYVDANPAAEALLEYSRDELLAMQVSDLVPEGPSWTQAEWQRYTESGSWQGELALRRKDGTTVPVEAKASIVAMPDRALYLSSIRDISNRRAAERMQREFITMITHDLKTPLTSIKGFAQLMQRRGQFHARAVDSIVAQTSHLERLINDLMDAARLEAGRAELRRSRIDLVSLAVTVLESARAAATTHALQLVSGEDTIWGHWDADRIAQVLHNLVNNAVKYSPEGGDVVVTVTRVRRDGVDEAQVSVSDQGIGVPEDALPQLFDRFFRADSSISGPQGLGLGLYISKSLVEAHGGSIGVESVPGHGSTFFFNLPLSDPVKDYVASPG